MLWKATAAFVVLWLLSIILSVTLGGAVHLLLVGAIFTSLARLYQAGKSDDWFAHRGHGRMAH